MNIFKWKKFKFTVHFLLNNFQEVPFQCVVIAMDEERVSSCGDNFLPDLGNEKDLNQLLFEQNVFRANDKFIEVNETLIRWFKTPVNSREYLKVALQNKNAYKNKTKSYYYDYKKGILYKSITNSDKIGMYIVKFYVIKIKNMSYCI